MNESTSTRVRVAIYRRISTDEANQPYSLEAQTERLKAFAKTQPGYEITHEFEDQASGATLDRPGLEAALRAAEKGEIDVLLIYRIDRLVRSMAGLTSIVEQLEAAGVTLKSATEPIDSTGPVGRMLVQILASFAELERGILIDRIVAGNERKARRGQVFGRAPIGYRFDSDGKTLLIDDDRATLVKQIFRMYTDEGMGATAIARQLNREGRRGLRGKRWSGPRVLDLLGNPTYTGMVRHRGNLYEGLHEAIIESEQFERAQAIRAERSRDPGSRASNDSEYVLSGITECSECGAAYIGASAHGNGGRYRYYICDTHQKHGATACRGVRVDADALESGIAALVGAVYADLDLFEEAVRAAAADAPAELERIVTEIGGVDAELADLQGRLERYYRAFESGAMTEDLVAPRLAEIQTQIEELTIHRDGLGAQRRDLETGVPDRDVLEELRDEIMDVLETARPAALKALYRALITNIVITPERIAHPELRVPSGDLPASSVPTKSTREEVRTPSRLVELMGRFSNPEFGRTISDLLAS